jgi:hypothetical protein
MIGLRLGFWDIADQSLQWFGRGAAWLLLRKHFTRDESTLCAATGGALVCAVLGGVVGFALSDFSRTIDVIGGAMLGGLLGVCLAIIFGVSVEVVSSTMKDLMRSLDSK